MTFSKITQLDNMEQEYNEIKELYNKNKSDSMKKAISDLRDKIEAFKKEVCNVQNDLDQGNHSMKY